MLTFETVLSAFKDYLAQDTQYEVILASRGYILLMWNANGRELESATHCPTPEAMKDELLSAYAGYLEYNITLCNRNLTDEERKQIEAQVQEMSDSI